MWMSWEGTFADGSPYREDTYTANLVTENGAANGISPPAPVDKLQRLMDGSHLTIRFWVSLAESPDKNTAVLFGVREHRVQTLPAVLPHPRFNDQPGATLTIQPLDHVDNASVTVAYGGMNPSHSIQLQWIFPDGGVADIGAKDGLDGGRVDFVITNEVLADSVGKTIELRYVATINGSPVPSEVQVLRVESIAPNNLPRPLINSIANGGSLNMDAIVGNPLASLAKWDLSKQGQKVWLTCTADRVEPLYILDGYSITSAEARNGLASKAVERSWFLYLASGGIFTLTCKVTFDGRNDESSAVVFQQTTYSIVRRVGVIGVIDVTHFPHLVNASPDNRRVYVNSTYETSAIDTASNSVIRTILQVTSDNCAISPDSSILYLIGVGHEVRAINTTNFNVIRTFSLPIGAFELALNSSGTQLYTRGTTTVDIYDANSGRHLASIPVPANGAAGTAYGMAFSADGSSFYAHGVIRTGVNGLFVIDTSTYRVITTIELPRSAKSLAADPHNTSLMYCTTSGEILIFNTDNHTLRKTILLPGIYRSTHIAVNKKIARAYVVTSSDTGTLLTFDTRTEEIIDSVDIPRRAEAACVLPDGSRLYTTELRDRKVTVIAL
jgi:DNA-binding beta-propeller fold protein YncE